MSRLKDDDRRLVDLVKQQVLAGSRVVKIPNSLVGRASTKAIDSAAAWVRGKNVHVQFTPK